MQTSPYYEALEFRYQIFTVPFTPTLNQTVLGSKVSRDDLR